MRYRDLRIQDGEEQVIDMEEKKWIPKWAMLPGYRYQRHY